MARSIAKYLKVISSSPKTAKAAKAACRALELSLQELTETKGMQASDTDRLYNAILHPGDTVGNFKVLLSGLSEATKKDATEGPVIRFDMLVCVPSADSKSVVKEPSEDIHEKDYIITCQRALLDVSCEPLNTWAAQACWLDGPGMAGYLLANKEDLLMPSFPDYGQESIKLHLDIRTHYYPTKLYVDDFFKQTLGPFKTGHLMPEVTRAHKVIAQDQPEVNKVQQYKEQVALGRKMYQESQQQQLGAKMTGLNMKSPQKAVKVQNGGQAGASSTTSTLAEQRPSALQLPSRSRRSSQAANGSRDEVDEAGNASSNTAEGADATVSPGPETGSSDEMTMWDPNHPLNQYDPPS